MVIDDDDLRLERVLARLRDEALLEARAFRADTDIRTRIDMAPERDILGQFGELRAVARLSLVGPAAHPVEVVHLIEAFEHRGGLRPSQTVQTDIVRAALQISGPDLSRN